MADLAKGTFSGTGQSGVVVGSSIAIRMDFSGTASVDIETQMPSGNWLKYGSSITADSNQVVDFGVMTAVRLNCTALTNNVEYLVAAAHE